MTTLPAPERTGDVRRLRAALAAASFDAASIGRLLGTEQELLTRPGDVPVHLRRLAGNESALATFVLLFVLGETVERDRVEAAAGGAALEELGLARAVDDGLRATVRLVPHDDLVIASDRAERAMKADHVAGVHRPSATLANLTVRRKVARALDVGTGNGIQAVLAARHAEHVVATDVNPRALVFAELNARLNGVGNVEFRVGSFLEPVAGERFGLIVANPPYVISPESELLFRDSGLGRDRVSEELVRALPAHLEDGGFATVMVSWIQEGDDESARLRGWLEGAGCDAWILHSSTDDPLSTAAVWNREVPPAEYGERIDRWLDYYRRERIDALAYGALVLRRRGGPNWARAAELKGGRMAPAGAHLERLFAAQDFLSGKDAAALLDAAYAFPPDAALEQVLGAERAGWTPREVTLRLDEGLGFRAGLDEATSWIVLRLARGGTLRVCLDDVARERSLDAAALHAAGVELVRRLLELGFLVPR